MMPKKNKKNVKFKNYERKIKSPLIIYEVKFWLEPIFCQAFCVNFSVQSFQVFCQAIKILS